MCMYIWHLFFRHNSIIDANITMFYSTSWQRCWSFNWQKYEQDIFLVFLKPFARYHFWLKSRPLGYYQSCWFFFILIEFTCLHKPSHEYNICFSYEYVLKFLILPFDNGFSIWMFLGVWYFCYSPFYLNYKLCRYF